MDGLCCPTTVGEKTLIEKVLGHLPQLTAHAGEVHYKKGQVLFYEGHYPCGLFVLQSGEIWFSKISLWGKTEERKSGEKNLLGVHHLITNTPHCITAQAKTNVVVLFIPKATVLDFLLHFSR